MSSTYFSNFMSICDKLISRYFQIFPDISNHLTPRPQNCSEWKYHIHIYLSDFSNERSRVEFSFLEERLCKPPTENKVFNFDILRNKINFLSCNPSFQVSKIQEISYLQCMCACLIKTQHNGRKVSNMHSGQKGPEFVHKDEILIKNIRKWMFFN